MKQRALTVIAFIGSFAWSLAFSQAPPQEAKQSTIGYASVAEALVALQANRKIQVAVQNGWTIATDQENKTLWSFSPKSDPSYPSAVKRIVEERNDTVFVHMDVLCEASKPACDNLVRQFQQLNERMQQQMLHGP